MQSSLLISLTCYVFLTLLFGALSKKTLQKDFYTSYYLGERSLGYLALSMSIFASYVSSGTFLAGLGASYKFGFVWLWIGPIQVVSVVFMFYIIGTSLRRISVRTKSITVPELLTCFYKNKYIGIFSAVAIIVFMPFMLMAQWQGGAYLVKNILDIDYKLALILFSLFVGTYTVLGGFKWVVATDILQGIFMFLGAVLIYFGIIKKSSGLSVISATLQDLGETFFSSSGYNNLLSAPYLISFWFLVGIGLLGLPQVILRFMAFKNKRALNKAMVLTPFVLLILMLALNTSGIYARVLLPNFTGNSDALLPEILPLIFNDFLASFVIIAVLSSIVSTADSILLIIMSSINYDLINKHLKLKENSFIYSAVFNKLVGIVVVFIIAVLGSFMQQDILYLNFLGFGAVQTVFFIPICGIIFNLRYKSNRYSAFMLCNMILSALLYCLLFIYKPSFLFGFHPVVYSLTFSVILHIIIVNIVFKKYLNKLNI